MRDLHQVRELWKLAVVAIIAPLLVTVAPTHAQTCDPEKPLTRPDSRYTDNGDGTITDKVTGLMWKQCVEGKTTVKTPCDTGFAERNFWTNAHQFVDAANSDSGFAGYMNWRMPRLEELKTLQEEACHSPAINIRYFPNTPPSYFWTADRNYIVYFDYALVNHDHRYSYHYFRLVRNDNARDTK